MTLEHMTRDRGGAAIYLKELALVAEGTAGILGRAFA